MTLKKVLLSSFLLATPLLIGGGVYVAQSGVQAASEEKPDQAWMELNKSIQFQVSHFPGTAGIYIKDLKTGWTIQYNGGNLFPSASLVKLPVMATLYQAQVKGQVSLDQSLPILRNLKASGSGRLKFQRAGTRVTIRQLIYKMITESDNTATNVLTNIFGLDYYNAQFMAMGLSRTNFSRTIMDLRKRDRGIENYTTPEDMAKILEKIYGGELTGSEEMVEILKSQKVNDRLPLGIPPEWQIGHKTGLMRSTCHDVGIVYAPTGDYIICALTKDIHSYRRAKNFISEISHLAADYYADPSLHRPEPNKSFWTKIWNRKPKKAGLG